MRVGPKERPSHTHQPVFLVGLPRTASKWVQDALNTYSPFCVIHETHILSLWHPINTVRIRRALSRKRLARRSRLRHLVLSGLLFGSFWRATNHQYTVFQLSSEELDDALYGCGSPAELLAAMMHAMRGHYGKPRIGARHPVHFVFLPQLFRWHPDARILFLTREATEVRRSQWARRIRSESSRPHRVFGRVAVTAHTYVQAGLAVGLLIRYRHDPRVMEVRYRDLVHDPESTFREICGHIGIEYDARMADCSRRYDSSFDVASGDVPPYEVHWSPPAEGGGLKDEG